VNELVASRRGDVLLVVSGAATPDELLAVGGLGGRFNRGVVTIVSERADEVGVSVPSNLRVVRIQSAEDLPTQWRAASTR